VEYRKEILSFSWLGIKALGVPGLGKSASKTLSGENKKFFLCTMTSWRDTNIEVILLKI
jgi:hypothetical protein